MMPLTLVEIGKKNIIKKAQATFLKYEKSQPSTINRYNAFVCGHCGRKLSYSKDRKKLIC